MLGQKRVILVIARVGSQLGRARIQVTDFQLQADHEAERRQRQAQGDAQRRPAALGEQVEETPEPVAMLARLFGVLAFEAQSRRAAADPNVGKQYG
ncbi:hypothetical protein D9M69_504680 [compost metagenome]